MIRASDLIGCRVRTESGRKLGKVHDLHARRDDDGDWLLEGLIVGRNGLRARLAGGDGPAVYEGDVLPWASIVRLEEGLVTVRDFAE